MWQLKVGVQLAYLQAEATFMQKKRYWELQTES